MSRVQESALSFPLAQAERLESLAAPGPHADPSCREPGSAGACAWARCGTGKRGISLWFHFPPGGACRRVRLGQNSSYDDVGWTTSADWLRDRFKRGMGAGNFHPGTSPVRSRLSANLRSSRATGLGPYSATASFTVTATPSSESLAFSCRSNQCLIDNATCATSCRNNVYIVGRLLVRKTLHVNAQARGRAREKPSSGNFGKRLLPATAPRGTCYPHCENRRTHTRHRLTLQPGRRARTKRVAVAWPRREWRAICTFLYLGLG